MSLGWMFRITFASTTIGLMTGDMRRPFRRNHLQGKSVERAIPLKSSYLTLRGWNERWSSLQKRNLPWGCAHLLNYIITRWWPWRLALNTKDGSSPSLQMGCALSFSVTVSSLCIVRKRQEPVGQRITDGSRWLMSLSLRWSWRTCGMLVGITHAHWSELTLAGPLTSRNFRDLLGWNKIPHKWNKACLRNKLLRLQKADSLFCCQEWRVMSGQETSGRKAAVG